MNRTLHLLGTFRFAKALLLSSFLVAALSLSACSDDPECEGDECNEAPVECDRNADCELGTYCGPDFFCEEDPCKEDTCTRGTCQRGSDVCTGAAGCEEETANVDCMFGEICQLGNCMDEQAFCDALACERGVCSFEEQQCVTATDCQGDSSLCLPGSYCNDMDQCVPDLCEVNEVECDDGGVCVPSLGECANPDTCGDSGDCLDDHICVLDSGSLGTCQLEAAACGDGPGDGGCYGNKICAYDPVSQLVGCEEASTCRNALDCNDDRQCVNRVCEAPSACVADDFEPNNEEGEATDFAAVANNSRLSGTLCADDSDYFFVDTLSLSQGLTEGALLVDLQYEESDVGLGEVELEVFAPDGTSLGVETSGRMGVEGSVAALVRLSTIAEGNYMIRVSSVDGMSSAGIRYSMSTSFSTVETQEACLDAVPLVLGAAAVSGNTSAGTSTALGSTCAGAENDAPEMIYSFEVESRSAINIYVIPNSSSTKLTASIRRACSLASSEVACQADVSSTTDTLSPLLEPGFYYLIVQGLNGSQGGGYTVSSSIGNVECTPADNTCIDADNANVCSADGSELVDVFCAAGCDSEINNCRRVEGDLCTEAIEKSEAFSATINWADYRPDIALSPGSCVPAPDGQTQTGGPDAVWAVTIPADKILDATLTFPDGEFGSMYILKDCTDPSLSCEIGANRGNVSAERIGYANETGAEETVYLVADRSPDDPMTQATLEVDFLDPSCDPDAASRCDGNGNIESCNEWGTQYDVSTNCDFGCNDDPDGGDATCADPTNDTCNDPLVLQDGQPVTAEMGDYSAQHDQECTEYGSSGSDAVYMVTTTVPNTRVKVELQSNFNSALYATTSCSTTLYDSCVAESYRLATPSNEMIEFSAPTAGSYYIFADGRSSSESNGEFTITATLTEPSCTPGEVISCNSSTSVEVCDAEGFPTVEPCRAACVDGACVIETGDTCEDPLPLTPGTRVTGDTGEFYPDYNLSSGSCTGRRSPGNDMVYKLETTAPGQIIDLTLEADFNASLYVSQECVASGGEPTCVAGQDVGGSADEEIVFVGHEAGTYYVHVDASSVSAYGSFTLSADVRNPTCTPGESLGCDGNDLEFCGPLGEVVNYACSSTCTSGACDDPNGDVCQEAIVVFDGETVGGRINASGSTNSIELNSGKNNQCLNGTSKTTGKESIHRVDLAAGELLTVEMTSDKASLVSYISESCVSAAQKCHAVDSNGEEGVLHYYAAEAGSVFIVVDATNGSEHNYQFTVDISSTEVCEPGGYRCLDADTLEVCSADGSEVLGTFVCADGCAAGTCAPSADANACGSAPSIGGVVPPNVGAGFSVQGNFAELTNSISVPADGCTRAEGKGGDMIYQVDLKADDVLEARVFSPSGENPMAYILSDCGDADSCLNGGKAEDGLNTNQEAYARYRAESSETVFVVADSANASPSGRFRLDISVSPAECAVGTTSCVDGENEAFCDEGRNSEQFCMYGSCSGGGCTGVAPNTCADAQVVPNDGQVHTYKGLLDDLENTVDLGTQEYECSGVGPSPGVDAMYAITLNAGDFLDVQVDSPADSIIWIAEGCTEGTSNFCHTGIDDEATGGAESLLYRAGGSATYYIMVDAASTDVSVGEYTVDIQVRSNECTPGQTECSDANTKRRCNSNRLWEETECYYGCDNGVCMDVTGDTCEDAIVVPNDRQPHTFNGLMEDYSKQSDIVSNPDTCGVSSSYTNGPEVFYAVEMNAGDVLEASWTSSDNGQLWITSSCADLYNQCISWIDQQSSSSNTTETLTYQAPDSGTYYVVGDNTWTSTNDGEFEMDIWVHDSECDPATYQPVCLDAATIQQCQTGAIVEQSCDCLDGECLTSCTAADDITADAAASGGVTFTGVWGDNELEYESYCGADGSDTDGHDFAYLVNLSDGERVNVSVSSTGLNWPAISFVESCEILTTSGACLASPSIGSSTSVSGSYTAQRDGPVYIVIDNDWPSGDDSSYTVDIDIQ